LQEPLTSPSVGEHAACLHELLAVQASPALQELLPASPRLHVVMEESRLERVAFTAGVSHSPMQLPYTTHLQHSIPCYGHFR
jgi:hypothetical protein